VRVTVVVVTRDRRASLLDSLARHASLGVPPPVIVVDTGSGDGTPAVVRRSHPGVRVVEVSASLGAAARTVGAHLATTPYVAFSDDDSWWADGALDRAADVLDDHPRLGLVAARILVEPGARLDPTCRSMRDSPLRGDEPLPGPAVLGFVACGAVVRRSAFLECGGFEPRFSFGGEEALLAIDMAAAGWRLAYLDDVVAHHRPVGGTRTWRVRLQRRNALWTVWLRRPLRAALAATAALSVDAGAETPRALASALCGLPWVLGRRRVVPPRVERDLRVLAGADARQRRAKRRLDSC
jgi:GT2 family glycosyltransferase